MLPGPRGVLIGTVAIIDHAIGTGDAAWDLAARGAVPDGVGKKFLIYLFATRYNINNVDFFIS